MQEAFQSVLETVKRLGKTLKFIQSDSGQEFLVLRPFFSENAIQWYRSYTPVKAQMAEAYVKLMAQKIHRVQAFLKTSKYIDHLEDIEKTHNNSLSTGMKFTPTEIVRNPDIEKKVMRSQALKLKEKLTKIDKKEKRRKSPTVGQRVRVVKDPGVFDKISYYPLYEKIGIIDQIYESMPKMYKILGGDKRRYFFEELKPVNEPLPGESTHGRASYLLVKTRSKANTGRTLCSGNKSNQATEYLIQGISDPTVRKYIDENTFLKFKKLGLILEQTQATNDNSNLDQTSSEAKDQ